MGGNCSSHMREELLTPCLERVTKWQDTKTKQTQQLVKGYATRLSDDVKNKLKAPPPRNIRFVQFSVLKRLGRWPRYPEDAAATTDLADMPPLNKFLMVYISHTWHTSENPDFPSPPAAGASSSLENTGTNTVAPTQDSPLPDNTKTHRTPDNSANDKYSLCVQGIGFLLFKQAGHLGGGDSACYVWFDYSCLDQSQSSGLQEYREHAAAIMGCCDCLFTPLVDHDQRSDQHQHSDASPSVSLSASLSAFRDQSTAIAWSGRARNSYLNRAWCRLEMW